MDDENKKNRILNLGHNIDDVIARRTFSQYLQYQINILPYVSSVLLDVMLCLVQCTNACNRAVADVKKKKSVVICVLLKIICSCRIFYCPSAAQM